MTPRHTLRGSRHQNGHSVEVCTRKETDLERRGGMDRSGQIVVRNRTYSAGDPSEEKGRLDPGSNGREYRVR